MKLNMKLQYSLNIPNNTKILIWKNDNKFIKVYLLNNKKTYKMVFINNIVKIDKWTNSIISLKKININSNIKINNVFKLFFSSWNFYFFKKIKFKGKGFRIKFFKKIKLIKFYFGRSHKTFFFLKKIIKKKLNKYKFMITGLNKNIILNSGLKITNIKKINLYTLRGLRFSRQIICKRKGKKGTYI